MDVEAATRESEAWRAKHEADYRRDWVTIAGLHFLEPGSHTAGSARSNDIVLPASAPPVLGRFMLANGIGSFRARTRSSGFARQPIGDRPRSTWPMMVSPSQMSFLSGTFASLSTAVANVSRCGCGILTVSWRVGSLVSRGSRSRWTTVSPGRFIPDATPRDMQVVNTFGDLDTFKTEGVVEFTLRGQTLRLRPFTTRPKRFYFVFRDASAGQETYEAARFLYADLREDGTTVLDFNQAYNPPCAFNPYTTCPIPLPENRLGVKILAGERAYPVHPVLPQS